MMDHDEAVKAAREMSKMISDLRAEAADRVRVEIEKEAAEMEAQGFDPAKGRGRGPWWADGA